MYWEGQDMTNGVVYQLKCTYCGQFFWYRVSHHLDRARMQPIDLICRPCFPEWWQNWASDHDPQELVPDGGFKVKIG